MTLHVITHNLAKQDLAEQAEYIRQNHVQAALRFLEAAERTFADLAATPGLGAVEEWVQPELAGLRCWRSRGFKKHLIFYLVREDAIEIVRVLYGARDIRAILGR